MADWIMFGVNREVRRVPLDFKWPLHERWRGYIQPKWRDCPSDDCEHGSTLAGRWLETLTGLILLAGSEGAENRERLHPWLRDLPLAPGGRPSPQMAELSAGLAGRPPRLGHDAIDRWAATKKIAQAAGLPEGWGTCPVCEGHAIHPDDREASEAWEATEPPSGPGWQLWETCSEGSPISPVFASDVELVDWATEHATIFGDDKAPRGTWEHIAAGSAEFWPLNGRESSANG